MQETRYTDTEMIVVAQARGPSIPRRTGNSKKLQQTNNPGPPVRKELQPGCNSTQNVSRFLSLELSLGGGLAFVYNNTTITCIFESVGDGSSKVRSGSASMHSRTNQPRRPNEMFWYWNAPLGSKVPLVSKVLKSLLTSITWPIRHMRVRDAPCCRHNQRMATSQLVPASEVDTDRFNNKHQSRPYWTQVLVVSAAE